MQAKLCEEEILNREWDEKTFTYEQFADILLELADREENAMIEDCVIHWMCLVLERRPSPNGIAMPFALACKALIKKLREQRKNEL